ncbi:MAG: hypothetical protein R3245_05540 [Kiloniellales bacterium]|nr:hypothetical protein [Kiloniellales bacterium]
MTKLRLFLERQRLKGKVLTYQELAIAIAMPPPHRIHRLTLMLEDLVREDNEAGKPLLAALVVSRGHERIPGRGFFQLLKELGRYEGADRGEEAIIKHKAELHELLASDKEVSGPVKAGTGP